MEGARSNTDRGFDWPFTGQTSHIRKLESSITSLTSENKRLKSQSSSISILQEEKLSLESSFLDSILYKMNWLFLSLISLG